MLALHFAVAGLALPQARAVAGPTGPRYFSSFAVGGVLAIAGLTLPKSLSSRGRASGILMAEAPPLTKFCLNVKLCIKPERRDEFMECIKNNKAGTLGTEPLAEAYIWGEDTETKNTFHFYEKYKGKAGFEAHQKTPHFAAWEKFASTDPFSEPPVVQFYEEL